MQQAPEETTVRWGQMISAAWEKLNRLAEETAAATIDVGTKLLQAKEHLQHGEFLKMVETELPFGDDMAGRLMKIAGDERLRDSAQWRNLPPHWRTLYELTKLTNEEFPASVRASSAVP